MSLLKLISQNKYEEIAALLLKENYVCNLYAKQYALLMATENAKANILSLLLSDPKKRFDPRLRNNLALRTAISRNLHEILPILVADSRINPSANNNEALCLAARLGNITAFSLLLAHPRIRLARDQITILDSALEKGRVDIIRLLIPYLTKAGIPWTTFIDPSFSDEILIKHIEHFRDNPSDYVSNFSSVSNTQCAAFEMLSLQEEIRELEKTKMALLSNDAESAMTDSIVIRARSIFELLKAQFINTFNQYGDDDATRIIEIEKLIRDMILDAIVEESSDENQKTFIALNRKKLTCASDQRIMKLAREKYFNTQSALHAAWRGYDAHAPHNGHYNLLTTPNENVEIFSTGISHQGAVSSMTASTEMRLMYAYYYLLITDLNEPEMLSVRKSNFILELADLRLAHQRDWHGEDAPSCYPGYLGRTLNLSFGHSLNQHLVTTKTIIMEYLSPIIIAEFRAELKKCHTAESCENVLQALSWLTVSDAKNILLHQTEYPESLLIIRNIFVTQLTDRIKIFYQAINQQLQAHDLPPLDKCDRRFVRLCLIDPTHQFNFGRIGAAYSAYVQERFPATPIKPVNTIHKIINPFKQQYLRAQKLLNSQPEALLTLKGKSRLFKKLKRDIDEKAKQELPTSENSLDANGMILLLKVAITEIPSMNLDARTLFSDTFENTLNENASSDEAYPAALHILQIFRNRTTKRKTPPPMSESPNKMTNNERQHISNSIVKTLFKN